VSFGNPLPLHLSLSLSLCLSLSFFSSRTKNSGPTKEMMLDIDNDNVSDLDVFSEDDEDEKWHHPPITCQRCSVELATVICRGCLGQFLCQGCDNSCHRMSWQAHIREPLLDTNPLAVTEGLLSKLVGVQHIKDKVREIVITFLEDRKTARLRGLKHDHETPVLLFIGNPGSVRLIDTHNPHCSFCSQSL
jgi:hypothetical protein